MKPSLARRVALATAIAVAAGGVSVAIVAGALLDHLLALEDDERLGQLAATSAGVEDDEATDGEDAEEDDLLAAPARVAIYVNGTCVQGDRALPRVVPGHCEDHGEMRVCARAGRRVVAIAAISRAPRAALRAQFTLAAAIAVLVTTLLGALGSFAIARWSLAPFARLTDAVRRGPTGTSVSPELGPAEGVVEVDALRAALVDAFARLGISLKQSERFAADAAHELRTPLTTILGELELLHEVVRQDPESADVVARVRTTAQRLSTLVERLLAMARAASPFEHTELVELAELVEDVVLELPPAEAARVRVEANAEVRVRGDQALLAALVSNALDNALKFSPGTPVVVRLARDGDQAVIEVDDEGAGVPPADRAQVFEPFRRGVAAATEGTVGHGIGLALVARVATAHGGTACFVDRPKGARLRVTLPAA